MVNASINTYRDRLLDILKLNPALETARGDWLQAEDGTEIYDALAQYGTLIFGHNNPDLRATLLEHVNSDRANFVQPLYSGPARDLLRRLQEEIPLDLSHVCYTNSGAEAVEAAIKLARIKTGKPRVLSLSDGFHGKTFAALSATGSDRYKLANIHDDLNFSVMQEGDLAALERALEQGDVAAFLFEPVLGEGGMRVVDPEYVHAALALCRRYGAVSIADEVQCGLGRCGALTCSQRNGYQVDALLLGKGLGGGLMPIGAVLYSRRVHSTAFDKKHSSTFAGGGLACAVALRVIDLLTRGEGALEQVQRLSARVDQHANNLERGHPNRVRVTGQGLMRGITFRDVQNSSCYFALFAENSGMLSYLICSYLLNQHNVFTMPLMSAPCAIRFEPALNTSMSCIDHFFRALDEIAQLIDNGRYDILMAHLVGATRRHLGPMSRRYPLETNDHPKIEVVAADSPDYDNFDFAFLTHITTREDFIDILPRAMQRNYSHEQLLQLTDLMMAAGRVDPSPEVQLAFRIGAGEHQRKGLLLFSPLTAADMMRLPGLEKLRLIDEYFACANGLGVKLVGLGAYTSVITRSGQDIIGRYPGVVLTTGNSLTAVTTCEQFLQLRRRDGDERLAIIGARGSVGSAIARSLLGEVSRLLLVGKGNTSLKTYRPFLFELLRAALEAPTDGRADSVLARIRARVNGSAGALDEMGIESLIDQFCSEDPESNAPISVSADVGGCLKRSSFVISCTSEGKAFLDDRLLAPGAIALDASRPFDFIPSGESTAKVYEAGLMKQPHDCSYGDCNMVIPTPGVSLACFSETVLLSMANAERHYSIGRSLNADDMQTLAGLARQHRFVPWLEAEVAAPRPPPKPPVGVPGRELTNLVEAN